MKKLNFGCGTDIKSEWDNCDIPKGLRKMLSLFIGGLIGKINVELKVIK